MYQRNALVRAQISISIFVLDLASRIISHRDWGDCLRFSIQVEPRELPTCDAQSFETFRPLAFDIIANQSASA